MPDILGIAALAVAVAALAASACSVVATRWLLQRILATLSAPPQPIAPFERTLTPEQERKLRDDFDAAMRDHRRTR